MAKKLPPVHPGEILMEDFLKPLGMSPHQLALKLNVPPNRISKLVKGRRSITPDTAMRLGRYFGTGAKIWMGLQANYDLQVAEDKKTAQIVREVKPRQDTETASTSA